MEADEKTTPPLVATTDRGLCLDVSGTKTTDEQEKLDTWYEQYEQIPSEYLGSMEIKTLLFSFVNFAIVFYYDSSAEIFCRTTLLLYFVIATLLFSCFSRNNFAISIARIRGLLCDHCSLEKLCDHKQPGTMYFIALFWRGNLAFLFPLCCCLFLRCLCRFLIPR